MRREADGALAEIEKSLSHALTERRPWVWPASKPRGPLVAVEVSGGSLKGIAARMRGEDRVLFAPFQTEVPGTQGSDEQRRGIVRVLKRRLKSTGARQLVCVLSSSRARTSTVELPSLSHEDLQSALALKALKMVGAAPEHWSVHALRMTHPDERPGGESCERYLISAILRRERSELESIFRQLGVVPTAMARVYCGQLEILSLAGRRIPHRALTPTRGVCE